MMITKSNARDELIPLLKDYHDRDLVHSAKINRVRAELRGLIKRRVNIRLCIFHRPILASLEFYFVSYPSFLVVILLRVAANHQHRAPFLFKILCIFENKRVLKAPSKAQRCIMLFSFLQWNSLDILLLTLEPIW